MWHYSISSHYPIVISANFVIEFKDYAKPKDWIKDIWDLDPEHPENNGLQNEDLIVWMRTAALPNFRKPYRKIDKEANFKDGIPKGRYYLDITYSE